MNFARLSAITLIATLVAATAPAHAGARSTVKVINESSRTVVAIHSSPRHRTSYGETDLLGRYTLRSGYQVDVDFDTRDAENKCWQDVVAKAADGAVWRKSMNICEESRWTLVD